MIQEHPNILCQQKAFEEVTDGFQFDSIATERTKWNNLDISNIMDNTEIVVQLIPLTKDNMCVGSLPIGHQFIECSTPLLMYRVLEKYKHGVCKKY